jgi:hypothetical protein
MKKKMFAVAVTAQRLLGWPYFCPTFNIVAANDENEALRLVNESRSQRTREMLSPSFTSQEVENFINRYVLVGATEANVYIAVPSKKPGIDGSPRFVVRSTSTRRIVRMPDTGFRSVEAACQRILDLHATNSHPLRWESLEMVGWGGFDRVESWQEKVVREAMA